MQQRDTIEMTQLNLHSKADVLHMPLCSCQATVCVANPALSLGEYTSHTPLCPVQSYMSRKQN